MEHHRLQRLKKRFTASSDMNSKIETLEAAFQRFQAEINMKLAITYEIMALHCERMNRSKSELQRQQDCETLLESWKNVEDLAANGLSLRILYDINNDMELIEIPDGYVKDAGTESTPNTHVASRKKRRRTSTSSVSNLSEDEADSDGAWDPNDSLLSKSRSKASRSNKTKQPGSGKRGKWKQRDKAQDSVQFSSRMKDDPPKLLKSEVLNYFEIRRVEGWARTRGICKHCNKSVSAEIQRLRNHVGKCSGRQNDNGTPPAKCEELQRDVKPLIAGVLELSSSTLSISGDLISYKAESAEILPHL